jgi:mono/diheme cytochrome c family protein
LGKIDEQISYNWLFFLLAGAFGAVTFWAVYDETATRREYKNYQEAFFKIETDLADKALKLEKTRLEKNAEYQQAVARKKQLEAELSGKKSALEQAKAKEQELGFRSGEKTQAYTFTKSLMDETYYYFTKAKHEAPNSAELTERKKKLDEYAAQLAKDEVAMNEGLKAWEDQKKVVAGFTAELVEKDALIEKLEADEKAAERKLDAAKEKSNPTGLTGLFGPATEIQQQNIEDIGKVDRCESCHVGSNRGGFETVQPKYFQSHPYRRTLFSLHPVERFGCTTCHDGQGRATTKFYAHAPTDNPHYAEKHFWEEPLLQGPMMEANCRKCHTEEYELRSYIRCETKTECPNGPDGKPLMCGTPAVPLNPSETSIPVLTASATGVVPIPGHETEQYCGTPSGVDPEKVVDAQLVDLAPHLARGRKIIEEVGCFGCHPIEGYEKKSKPAPDLRHARSKLNPGWIVEWVKDPKSFHPNTRMPNFFPEEKRANDEYPKTALPVRDSAAKNPSEPWKWSVGEQTTALASYLIAQSTPFEIAKLPVAGDAARGKQLVLTLGCRGCHNITEDKNDASYIDHKNRGSHYDHGPNLNNVGSKTGIEWLYAWLKDPKAYAPGTRMPNLRLANQEAADIATYLADNKDRREFPSLPGINPDDKEWVKSGEKLMNYYGCYGCHFINGYEDTAGIGAELTEFGLKEVARLDYGDYIVNHRQQTWEAWLENKLKHPRVYRYERVDTRMPQFDFTPEEVQDLMVVLKGMRGKTVEAALRGHKLSPLEHQRERGREIVRTYNCYGCHTVDSHTGDIRQAKEYQGDTATFAPPIINGEGAKTQPPWLFAFFKDVKQLRPWLSVRMPTFGFNDEEATSLVAMFSAFDHADYPYRYYDVPNPMKAIGQALFTNLKCTSCHVVGDVKLSPEDAQKAAPNLLMAKSRLRAEWIVKWLSNPEAIQPGTRMPSFWSGGANLLQSLMSTPDGKQFSTMPGIDKVSDAAVHQMEVVRDHVFTLEGAGAAAAPVKGAKKASAPRKKAVAPVGERHAQR